MMDEINKDVINLNEIKETSILFLKNFFKLLDLDFELFDSICYVNIAVKSLDGKEPACYYPHENLIVINSKHLDERTDRFLNCDNEADKKKIKIDVVSTMIHEMIHSLRVVKIKDGFCSNDAAELYEKEKIKFEQLKQGHDLNQYRLLLSDMLYKPYVKKFKNFIPVKVKLNKDGSYTIIAYDRKTKNYAEFDNQHLDIKIEDDADKFMLQIGLLLNNDTIELEHKTINSFIADDKDDFTILACDYYHPYSKSGRLVNKSNEELKNMTAQEFENELSREKNLALLTAGYFENFEEIITETLTTIVVLVRNKNELDLDDIVDKICHLNGEDDNIDVTTMAKFIQKMGIEFIKWFFVSPHQDYYENYIEETFKEDTSNLLKYFSELYQYSIDNETDSSWQDSISNYMKKLECKQNIKKIDELVNKRLLNRNQK